MPIYTTLDDGESYLEELPVSLGTAIQAAGVRLYLKIHLLH